MSNPRLPARAQQKRSLETREALLIAAGKVFSRLPYSQARLKDIADEAGISQGSLYFHFGNKDDIAAALLETQQELMTAALTRVVASPGSGLMKVLDVGEELAKLISSDPIVQAGIHLSAELGTSFEHAAHEPYFEWIRIARSLLQTGVEDGSVDPSLDIDSAAAFVNEVFVGVQVISQLADSWKSMPARMKAARSHLETLLAGLESRTNS